VAAPLEVGQRGVAEAVLDPQLEWVADLDRVGAGPDLPARLLDGGLGVEAAVDQAGDGLQVPLRLEIAAGGVADEDGAAGGVGDQVAVECPRASACARDLGG
jgi:hypothetical protein